MQRDDDVGRIDLDVFDRRRDEAQTRVAELARDAVAELDELRIAIDAEHVRLDAERAVAVVVQREGQIALAASHVDDAQSLLLGERRSLQYVVENLDQA